MAPASGRVTQTILWLSSIRSTSPLCSGLPSVILPANAINGGLLNDPRILVIGAGLSGATAARVLAESGFAVTVVEKETHPGGHCHSYRDADTGIMVHAHGPHILHSDTSEVWAFLQ